MSLSYLGWLPENVKATKYVTFEYDTDDPSLFTRSRTVVDLLKCFSLLILLSYVLGYLVEISVQIINGKGPFDDRRSFTDHLVQN